MADRKTLLYRSSRSSIWKVDSQSKGIFVTKEFACSSAESSLEIGLHEELKDIPGVVGFRGGSYAENPILYMQYCEQNSLKSCLEQATSPLSEDLLMHLYGSMAETVRVMHTKRIAHRVINTSNWLVTGNQFKLTDFGHAKKLDEEGWTHSASLKDEEGENTGARTRQIFAEDALHLARVFYQMATFDFSAQVLFLQPDAIATACGQRGYSEQVSSLINHLLQLRNRAARQVEVGQILLLQVEHIQRSLNLEDLTFLCSYCGKGKGDPFPSCGHFICETCKKRLSRNRYPRELECELCENDITNSPGVTVEQGDFDFDSLL